MESVRIACAGCGQLWELSAPLSYYERKALRTHPCPHCGEHTLACDNPADEPAIAATGETTERVTSA